MVDDPDELIHLVITVGRGTQVNFAGKVFGAEFGLVQAAGGAAGQITAAMVIGTPCGIPFLCQQDFAACPVLDGLEDFKVVFQKPPVNQIAGGGQCVQIVSHPKPS